MGNKPKKSNTKTNSIERWGLILAVVGTVITGIFSSLQLHQANLQLQQGQTAIQQTQAGLTETRKQNKLSNDQLNLAKNQFRYSQRQDSLKDRQDSLDKLKVEQNKMRYLHFLMTDTDIMLSRFHWNTRHLQESFKANPFVIPNYIDYPAHSVEVIATGINQEEYYLSSVRQLKSNDIAEIFPLYNTLYILEKKAREHYSGQFSLLIENKIKALESKAELVRSVEYYLLDTDLKSVTPEERYVYSKLQEFNNQVNFSIPQNISPDEEMLFHKNNIINPLVFILQSHKKIKSLRGLLLQAYNTLASYNTYVYQLRNVVNFIVGNDNEIKYVTSRIKPLSQSLNNYVHRLPKQ